MLQIYGYSIAEIAMSYVSSSSSGVSNNKIANHEQIKNVEIETSRVRPFSIDQDAEITICL